MSVEPDIVTDEAIETLLGYVWAMNTSEGHTVPERFAQAQQVAVLAGKIVELATLVKRDCVMRLEGEGLSLRQIAAHVGLTFQRVSQIIKTENARRAAEWGVFPADYKPNSAATRLDDYRAARYAQELRADRETSGFASELAAFYGDFDSVQRENAETRLTLGAFMKDAGDYNKQAG